MGPETEKNTSLIGSLPRGPTRNPGATRSKKLRAQNNIVARKAVGSWPRYARFLTLSNFELMITGLKFSRLREISDTDVNEIRV